LEHFIGADKMNTKIWIGGLSIIVLAVATIFIQSSIKKDKTAIIEGEIQKINLGVTSPDLSALIWVAEKKGFFIENGLDVNIEEHIFSGGILKGLVAGELDLGTTMEVSFAMDELVDRGDMKIVSVIAKSDRTELIARKDHGIDNVSDLKGKKIGVTPATNAEFFLGAFLAFNNLILRDIDVVYLSPPDLVSSITNGSIDAAITWTTNVYQIITALGDNAISWSAQSGQSSNWILVTSKNFIEKNPEAIQKFVQALVDAEEHVQANGQELYDIILSHEKITKDYLDYAEAKQQYVVELPQSIIMMIEDQTRWAMNNKLAHRDSIPNYLSYIYTGALEKIKPKAVTIIR
jgi:NitT/TauT family transport system substrate-binding protein